MPVRFCLNGQENLVDSPKYKKIVDAVPYVANRMALLRETDCDQFIDLPGYLPGYQVCRMHVPNTNRVVLKLRDSIETRLIFTYFTYRGENHPLILSITETHDLDLTILKKGRLDAFFASHIDAYKSIVDARIAEHLEEIKNNTQKEENKTVPVTIIGKNAIVLDEQQRQITAPAVVEGPAGSGKTCVGYHLLEEYVRNNAGDLAGKKILYVSQSKQLVKSIRQSWEESPHRPEGDDPLDILTYEELLQKLNPELRLTQGAKEKFDDWYKKRVVSKVKGKQKIGTQLTEGDRDFVWQEFRAMSGHEGDLSNRGSKQTTFSPEQQDQLVSEYQNWVNFCKESHFNFLEFVALKTPEADEDEDQDQDGEDEANNAPYDMVFVDESQDLSIQALKNLIKIVNNHQIIYALDSRQNLSDSQSKTDAIKKIFYDERVRRDLAVVQLQGSYRSKPQVMQVAKAINNLRIEKTPTDKRAEVEIIIKESNEPGRVIFFDTKKEKSFQDIKAMSRNADVCIITTKAHKAILLGQGFSQVFTPDDLKGLEYKIVVLYNILSEQVFKDINNKDTKDWAFSIPLANVFTAITRAEDALYVYQENEHAVRKILDRIKPFVATKQDNGVNKKDAEKSTEKRWLAQALKVYEAASENGENIRAARRILKDEVGMTEAQISAWVREQGGSPEPEEVQEVKRPNGFIRKREKAAKGFLSVADPKSHAEGFRILADELGYNPDQTDAFLLKHGLPKKVEDKPSKESKNKPKKQIPVIRLDEAIENGDIVALGEMLKSDHKFDWNHETFRGKRAVDVICAESDVAKLLPLLDLLFKKPSFDINAKSKYMARTAFMNTFLIGRRGITRLFMRHKDFDLRKHQVGVSVDEISRGIQLYINQRAFNVNDPILPQPLLDFIKAREPKKALFFAFYIAKQYYPNVFTMDDIPDDFMETLHDLEKKLKFNPMATEMQIFVLARQLNEIAYEAGVPEAYFHKGVLMRSWGVELAQNDQEVENSLTMAVVCFAEAAKKNISGASERVTSTAELLQFSKLGTAPSRVDRDPRQQAALQKILDDKNTVGLTLFLSRPGSDPALENLNWDIEGQSNGVTVLSLMADGAVPNACEKAKKLIADKKVCVNPYDDPVQSALLVALQARNYEFVDVLMESGRLDINVNLKRVTEAAGSALLLAYAARTKSPINSKLVDYLEQKDPEHLVDLARSISNREFGTHVSTERAEFIANMVRSQIKPEQNAAIDDMKMLLRLAANAGLPVGQYLYSNIMVTLMQHTDPLYDRLETCKEAIKYHNKALVGGVLESSGILTYLSVLSGEILIEVAEKVTPCDEKFKDVIKTGDLNALYLMSQLPFQERKSCNWNICDPDTGMTLLMLVCKHPHEKGEALMDFLLNTAKVDVNVFDKSGNTPFVYAGIIQAKKPAIMKQLLLSGRLDLKTPFPDGFTPADAGKYQERCESIVNGLLTKNEELAEICQKNHQSAKESTAASSADANKKKKRR